MSFNLQFSADSVYLIPQQVRVDFRLLIRSEADGIKKTTLLQMHQVP